MDKIKELLKSDSPIKWLFTGDSITHGVLHTYGHRDYVQLFEERLRFELARYKDVVIRTAVSGWTTQDILNDIEWNVLQFNPDVFSIMIGMNDASKVSIDDFTDNYRRILDIVDKRTTALAILHTPNPAVAGFDSTRDSSLPKIVESVRNLGQERGIPVVDHYAEWTLHLAQSLGSTLPLMNDCIHPNSYGHQVFARLLMKELGIWGEKSTFCGPI